MSQHSSYNNSSLTKRKNVIKTQTRKDFNVYFLVLSAVTIHMYYSILSFLLFAISSRLSCLLDVSSVLFVFIALICLLLHYSLCFVTLICLLLHYSLCFATLICLLLSYFNQITMQLQKMLFNYCLLQVNILVPFYPSC